LFFVRQKAAAAGSPHGENMGSIIARILVFVGILWLIRQIVVSFRGGGKPQKRTEPEAGNVMVKDPVCGMYMDARLAVRLEKRGETLYFCSEECKTKFLSGSPTKKIGA